MIVLFSDFSVSSQFFHHIHQAQALPILTLTVFFSPPFSLLENFIEISKKKKNAVNIFVQICKQLLNQR